MLKKMSHQKALALDRYCSCVPVWLRSMQLEMLSIKRKCVICANSCTFSESNYTISSLLCICWKENKYVHVFEIFVHTGCESALQNGILNNEQYGRCLQWVSGGFTSWQIEVRKDAYEVLVSRTGVPTGRVCYNTRCMNIETTRQKPFHRCIYCPNVSFCSTQCSYLCRVMHVQTDCVLMLQNRQQQQPQRQPTQVPLLLPKAEPAIRINQIPRPSEVKLASLLPRIRDKSTSPSHGNNNDSVNRKTFELHLQNAKSLVGIPEPCACLCETELHCHRAQFKYTCSSYGCFNMIEKSLPPWAVYNKDCPLSHFSPDPQTGQYFHTFAIAYCTQCHPNSPASLSFTYDTDTKALLAC